MQSTVTRPAVWCRDCNPGIPESRDPINFPIPKMSRTQSRDFGINNIYLTVFLVLLKIILCIYSFFDAFLSPQWGGEGAVVLKPTWMQEHDMTSDLSFEVNIHLSELSLLWTVARHVASHWPQWCSDMSRPYAQKMYHIYLTGAFWTTVDKSWHNKNIVLTDKTCFHNLQFFYAIWYLSHSLTFTGKFSEIIPGEPLHRGV